MNLRIPIIIFLLAVSPLALLLPDRSSTAQTNGNSGFRPGERLTYTLSYDRYRNAGFAELAVVSAGKLGDRDAFELRAALKTNDLVSAVFLFFDERRTVFAAADSGLPLYSKAVSNKGVTGAETVIDNTAGGSAEFDFVTLLYRLRESGGTGAFRVREGDAVFTVTAQAGGSERVKTGAGEFETLISNIDSPFLAERGVSAMRVNLTTDGANVPALIRFRYGRGEVRIELAGIESSPSPTPATTATPTPSPTAAPVRTPTPKPSPPPYIENQPLSDDLPFVLGERLDYSLTANGQAVGSISLEARERKLFPVGGVSYDGLLLQATVTDAKGGNGLFLTGDFLRAVVDPATLHPYSIENRFNGAFAGLNQTARFEQPRGLVFADGAEALQIPVNTHSLLSLVYAARSFNLKPSSVTTNPVNDTRVAVFFGQQFSVFVFRPDVIQTITVGREKISAQLVTVLTGLQAYPVRVWMTNDPRRVPVRISVGPYQADLVTEPARR